MPPSCCQLCPGAGDIAFVGKLRVQEVMEVAESRRAGSRAPRSWAFPRDESPSMNPQVCRDSQPPVPVRCCWLGPALSRNPW